MAEAIAIAIFFLIDNIGNGTLTLIERKGLENHPLQCVYNKTSFKKTAKELELTLTTAGFEVRQAKKFNVLFSKIWIETERQQQKTQRDYILEEIRKRRKNTLEKTYC